MKLSEYIDQNLIFADFRPDDKSGLLEKFANAASEQLPGISAGQLHRKLAQREEAGSTGIGHGVAVPHARIDGLEKTVCLLFIVSEGVDFDSIDRQAVRVVFLLISPPTETGLHIKLLARIARIVKSKEFVEAVAASSDPAVLFELIEREDNRHG